jgi:hypothetical protein
MTLADGLTLLFIGLKLSKVINWSWWWVLAPQWMVLLVAIVAAIIVVLREEEANK